MASDLENDFLVLLYDVARHIRTHADQASRETGLTRAQWIILARLKREPGLSQNELAALAGVAPITVARLVDRLEALSLVERRADQEDRRIWRLRLTPAAAPVLRDLKRYRAELHDITTRGIDPAVLRTMRSGLRQMKDQQPARCRGIRLRRMCPDFETDFLFLLRDIARQGSPILWPRAALATTR